MPLPAGRAFATRPRVIGIDRKKLGLIALLLLLIAAGAWAGYSAIHASTPVRIGVLLALTGDVELREPLDWAQETINSQGGVGGRPVELVYKDTGSGDINKLAQELLDDDSIHIIIGPEDSDDVYLLAPQFIEKQKVLISPTATSGDIIRAFGKTGYVWRTTQGDAAQVKTILMILKEKGVKNVALLVENTTYGRTFYDWTGFFANEYGIGMPFIRQYERGSPTLDADVAEALKTDPDYIIAASCPEDAATIKRAIDRSGSRAKLFVSDDAAQPALLSALKDAAVGIEGTNPTADPSTGFTEAYEARFGHPPETGYAATAYDALLIAAYTEARQDAAPFESRADSVRKVVYGDGIVTGWDPDGVRTALSELGAGRLPWITGASGGLEYDETLGVDQLYTFYSHWVVENGTFRTVRTISSLNVSAAGKTGGDSAGLSTASEGLMPRPGADGTAVVAGERKDFRAVIAGPSRGWQNYRHQADALTLYTLLRENGVSDDQIILMVYDDIPGSPQNPRRGDIHNVPKGENIRSGAVVDYAGPQVTAATLHNVLLGTKTDESPVVLESDAETDVFVYIASHGAPGEIIFGHGNEPFTAADFTRVTDTMEEEGRYRQMVFVVDTCFGESIALNTTARGIYYLTGAAKNEPSLGAVYDMDIRQWLSDEFTVNVVRAITADPGITFRDLYPATYRNVTGSHVRLVMTPGFSIDTPVMEYLRP